MLPLSPFLLGVMTASNSTNMCNKYVRLVNRGIVAYDTLERFIDEALGSGVRVEDFLLSQGIPKYELLLCLAEYYRLPFVEFDESLVVSLQIMRSMDGERLKRALWLPLSAGHGRAEVVASYPDDPLLLDDVKSTLQVSTVDFRIGLPSDIVRIIEHNQDLNPHFPPVAARTQLAKVRTLLAGQRSRFACLRTALARGRTGLAFLRTGLSFITITMVLARIFGAGYLSIIEAVLLVAGIAGVADGLVWYLPARRAAQRTFLCDEPMPTGGTTVLDARIRETGTLFLRTPEVPGAADMRRRWQTLSPVMRRRFLASDRTDLAEERNALACFRTSMAKARTGLSFMRTGVAFIGLGIALLRQFPASPWTIADAAIILLGTVMLGEGLFWYAAGRQGGVKGDRAIRAAENRSTIWNEAFTFLKSSPAFSVLRAMLPPVKGIQTPGVWATTGLALERTLLAERRNLMARLRTVMARSRTGLAFIRTGLSMAGVGLGLLVYFGAASFVWTAAECFMIAVGALFITDGFVWHIPAERERAKFPYCFGGMEIADADYGRTARTWSKVEFSHDDI